MAEGGTEKKVDQKKTMGTRRGRDGISERKIIQKKKRCNKNNNNNKQKSKEEEKNSKRKDNKKLDQEKAVGTGCGRGGNSERKIIKKK